MTPDTLGPEWDEYLESLRADAHQLLAWGHADCRTELPSATDEYEMTGKMSEAMKRRIDDPRTEFHYTHYSVHNEAPISPGGESGLKRPRLDISIERTCCRPKRYFTFEAKRLRDDGACNAAKSTRKYVGREGMGAFVSDEYAAESWEGGMLGFVEVHDCDFWLGELTTRFDEDASDGRWNLAIIESLRREHVIDDLSFTARSDHRRKSGRFFRMFHVLLDCVPEQVRSQ